MHQKIVGNFFFHLEPELEKMVKKTSGNVV